MGTAFRYTYNLEPEREIPIIDIKSLNFRDLYSVLEPYGHHETPFLNKLYSPYSVRPTIDYSEWLFHRIIENDAESVIKFTAEIGKFTPILSIGADAEEYWVSVAKKILSHPDVQLLKDFSSEGCARFRAFLILGHLFNIEYVYDLGEILAAVIIPYDFSIQCFDIPRAVHNKYIEFLREYKPDFEVIDFKQSALTRERIQSATMTFLSTIAELQPTQRIFLLAESEACSRFTNTITFWRGSDFFRSSIWVYEYDYNFVLDGMAKYEIQELLEKAHIPFRRSARKHELETLLSGHRDLLDGFIRDRKISRLNPSLEEGYDSVKIMMRHLTGLMSSWLLYAFKKDWPYFREFFYARCIYCGNLVHNDSKVCRMCSRPVIPGQN